MALINFAGAYELIFKSFDISADTKLVTQLEADGVKKLIIIKRSWIFGIFKSWIFFLMFIIMAANIYLIYLNFKDTTIAGIIAGILCFVLFFWFLSIVIYFHKFKKIYGVRSTIVDVSTLKEQLSIGDYAFSKFFNQTIFNYLILIGITIYTAYYLTFVVGFTEVGVYGGLNIFLLFVQIYLSAKFKKRMLDLEMDFSIVVPGKIIFYNQSNLKRSEATINSEKIKTITSEYAGIFGSILNYGDITVMTEGDEANVGEIKLHYIAFPTETVYEINELLGMGEKK